MTTTTALGFPKPEATDQIALGYDAIADLADALNAYLTPRNADSGWITAGFTAQTNWTNLNSRCRKIGSLVYVHIEMTRTTVVKAAPASGDMGNEAVVTIPAGYRPLYSTAVMFEAATRTNGGGLLVAGGGYSIYSMNSDSTIEIGDVLIADTMFYV